MPRMAAKWALVAILVPFLLVGCASLDKACQIFEAAGQSRSERLLGLKSKSPVVADNWGFL